MLTFVNWLSEWDVENKFLGGDYCISLILVTVHFDQHNTMGNMIGNIKDHSCDNPIIVNVLNNSIEIHFEAIDCCNRTWFLFNYIDENIRRIRCSTTEVNHFEESSMNE